jgi:hypothetical protein
LGAVHQKQDISTPLMEAGHRGQEAPGE